jgi:hypothetical protein
MPTLTVSVSPSQDSRSHEIAKLQTAYDEGMASSLRLRASAQRIY